MKRIILAVSMLWSCFAFAQKQSLELSFQQAEELFFAQNADLLIEKLAIDKAEATLLQAQLRPNPSLSISEVNLWKNGNKYVEELPNLIQNWGNSTQISAELEQMIQTASKRKKLVAAEKVNQQLAAVSYQDLIWNLKFELRKSLINYQSIQETEKLYQSMIEQINELVNAFEKQLIQKNVSKLEVVRLKSLQFQFEKELADSRKEKNKAAKELKQLLALDADWDLVIENQEFDELKAEKINTLDWMEFAFENRLDLKISALESEYLTKKLIYEKAQRIPDLTLAVNYDRGGSIMRDFVGFGIRFDLPFFDRNQGNIQLVQVELEQQKIQQQKIRNAIKNELNESFQNFQTTWEFYQNFQSGLLAEMEEFIPIYQQNYLQKNISLIEYIDYVESYIENKRRWIDLMKEVQEQWEEIEYNLGKNL